MSRKVFPGPIGTEVLFDIGADRLVNVTSSQYAFMDVDRTPACAGCSC
jgi:hypothetical protein